MPDVATYWTYGPELAMRERENAQRIREREDERRRAMQIRQEELASRFGEDAVIGPDGGIDVLASSRRQAASQQAAQLGEAEGQMGMSIADADPALRDLPSYRRGAASGITRRALEERRLQDQLAIQEAIQNRYMAVQGARNEGAQMRANLEAWEGMPGAFREMERSRQATEEKPTVTIKRKGPGGLDIEERVTQEGLAERQRAIAEEKVAQFNEGLDQAIQDIETSGWNKVIVTPDGVGGFTVKQGGMLSGGMPASEAKAKLTAAKRQTRMAAGKLPPQVQRFLEGEDVSTPTTPIPARPEEPPMPGERARQLVNREQRKPPGTNEFYLKDGKLYRMR